MTILLATYDMSLPLTNPVMKFFLILVIILFAPIIFNKLRIPYLLGLIIAGALVGPNGFNLITRDSSIILSGTAGLLYIMFLAGLEIEMNDFRRNAAKSTLLGLSGFIIPMILGTLLGVFILKYSLITSVLLASMLASHTLITYPVASKLGILRNIAVNVSVSSTLITNTLALLVLAVIVGMSNGELSAVFWVKLISMTIGAGAVILLLFPLFGRWFFKRYDDPVSQYIFVLAMVFFGSVLAQLAGIEAIIGAFLAGLSFNKLIPRTSPLMNRVGFVGNAIFIPFFLIGVGMLIDYRAFFTDTETFRVALTISIVATLGKYLAALVTQKTYRLSADERRVIFGLTNSQAAATLAAVLIGYNIIIGHDASGEPVRLLNEAILNGTIIMILVTCTIASFVTQRGASGIALTESAGIEGDVRNINENILIPVSNPETAEELTNLSLIVKSRDNRTGLHALSILNNTGTDQADKRRAARVLEKVVATAAAADAVIDPILRYDSNVT
ncbi:MAG: cation:proton antiporter, partial [Bacteroidetes bacterium]|nr:cation:proton antiporter [Bacteroidota bacterium]